MSALLALLACGGRTQLRGEEAGAPSCTSGAAGKGECPVALCNGGACTAVLSSDAPVDVATDGANVFWTDASAVMRASACGGDVSTLASCARPGAIALDDTNVYFVDDLTAVGGAPGGVLVEVPKGGGTPITLATVDDRATGLAAFGGSVYWTTSNADTGQGAVWRVPAAGGARTAIFTGDVGDGLAVDASSVYFSSSRAVVRASHDGAGLETIVDLQHVEGIAVDATSVYWTDGCGRVTRFAFGQPSLSNVLAYGTDACNDGAYHLVAVAGGNVYWTAVGENTFGRVLRESIDGGSVTTLVADTHPSAVAVSSSRVYWTNDVTLDAVSSP